MRGVRYMECAKKSPDGEELQTDGKNDEKVK